MTVALLFLLVGLVALVIGGEMLVRGAVGIGGKAKLSPLVIGVVVVGLGTSMPEFVTSVEAVLAGSPQLAWGNIVGSNIANILLILGLSAVVAPIALPGGGFLRDPVFGLIAAVLVLLLALAEIAHVAIGVMFLALMVACLLYSLRKERIAPVPQEEAEETGGWGKPVILTVIGLGVLIVGGQMLVNGAIDLARIFGMSEALIGVTVVAIGTSLPELVTAVVAARKGEPEVAFGNVAGSNLYNILLIGGATLVMAPEPLPRALLPFDLFLMTGAAFALVVLAFARRKVSRRSGIVLLAGYAVFMAWHISRI